MSTDACAPLDAQLDGSALDASEPAGLRVLLALPPNGDGARADPVLGASPDSCLLGFLRMDGGRGEVGCLLRGDSECADDRGVRLELDPAPAGLKGLGAGSGGVPGGSGTGGAVGAAVTAPGLAPAVSAGKRDAGDLAVFMGARVLRFSLPGDALSSGSSRAAVVAADRGASCACRFGRGALLFAAAGTSTAPGRGAGASAAGARGCERLAEPTGASSSSSYITRVSSFTTLPLASTCCTVTIFFTRDLPLLTVLPGRDLSEPGVRADGSTATATREAPHPIARVLP